MYYGYPGCYQQPCGCGGGASWIWIAIIIFIVLFLFCGNGFNNRCCNNNCC